MFIARKAFAFTSNLMHLDSMLIRRIQNHILQDVKSKSTNIDLKDPALEPKFTKDEQEKILNTLNTIDVDQLSSFNISRRGIKNLESLRTKKGYFRTLSDILEVEGLGENVIEELCEKILSRDEKSIKKSLKNLIVPALTKNQIKNINTAIGLQLDPVGIAWAKISQDDNELCEWNFHDFTTLPKKVTPIDLFHMAVKVLNVIPPSDIYVLEAPQNPQNQKKSNIIPTYTQHLEFSSMLIALINTSERHNSSCEEFNTDGEVEYTNKVYYLRHYLPARLFKTLVGNERVSSADVVKKLLIPENNQLLPCTPVSVNEEQIKSYFSYSSANRHLLEQALLLTISFMDTCVYKNPKSLNALVHNRKTKLANKSNLS